MDEDGEGNRCMTCGGDGWEWCDEQATPEGCWERGCDGVSHPCPNCGGSGLAEDQFYW